MVVRSLEKESTVAKSFPVSISSGTISLTNIGEKAIYLFLIYSSKPKIVKPIFWPLDIWVFQFWVCNPWPWDFPNITQLLGHKISRGMKYFPVWLNNTLNNNTIRCILCCYYSKCYSIILEYPNLWCFIIILSCVLNI